MWYSSQKGAVAMDDEEVEDDEDFDFDDDEDFEGYYHAFVLCAIP